MILISQAYVLQKVWEIKTKNKSYLKCLLKYWTSHLSIKKKFQSFLANQGMIGSFKLDQFKEENWKEWINFFNRYSFSSKEWSKITPKQWRKKVSQHWKKEENNNNLNISKQNNKISTFINSSLLEQIKKRNKIFKQNFLTYSYLNFTKNSIIQNFLNLKRKKIYNNIIINKIQKSYFIYNKKAKNLYIFFQIPNNFFKYNLLIWLIPEFVEDKIKYQTKKISFIKNSIIKENKKKIIQNSKLFRKREINQSIRQWRWKSKSLEKKFKKLGNMASLMTFMQNKENIISLSSKMQEDLELFHLFFRRNNNNINQLTIHSEHRLARLLDDQIFMYKMVSTFLNLKYKFKQISDLENLDNFLGIKFLKNKEKTNFFFFNSSNIENILLPKRRRSFRVLNSLTSKEKKYIQFNEKIFKKKFSKNKIKKIKRFLWITYRFEDLACMNRFWFNTINGSRFSMLRLRMYPSLLT